MVSVARVGSSILRISGSGSIIRVADAGGGSFYELTSDRVTTWQPGVTYNGGIPTRSTIYTTINASTYGNGASDARAGIQAALDACPTGQVVKLSAGDFKISSGELQITRSITLRGSGPTGGSQTRLVNSPVGSSSSSGLIWLGANNYHPSLEGDTTNSKVFTSDGVKGTYSCTLNSVSGLSVGQLVLIDSLYNSALTAWAPGYNPADGYNGRPNRPLTQMMEIASIVGSTVTFTTPFHITFDVAHTAQLATWSITASDGIGLEDLSCYGGGGGFGNITMEFCKNSWVKNVESYNAYGCALSMFHCLRNEVRDSYVHDSNSAAPGGGGYGIDVSNGSSDCLVENNIIWNFNIGALQRACGGGNVWGYNYLQDSWDSTSPNYIVPGFNPNHMTTPCYSLWEGNSSFNIDGDTVWGNAIYQVIFRNRFTGLRTSKSPLSFSDSFPRQGCTVGIDHWYYSFVGNVLGYSGQSGITAYEWSTANGEPAVMWRIGYDYRDGNQDADATTVARTLRDGNYDYYTASVRWHGIGGTGSGGSAPSPSTFHDSLYIPTGFGKPSFFGSDTYPWVDSQGATKFYTQPAEARFLAGTPFTPRP